MRIYIAEKSESQARSSISNLPNGRNKDIGYGVLKHALYLESNSVLPASICISAYTDTFDLALCRMTGKPELLQKIARKTGIFKHKENHIS